MANETLALLVVAWSSCWAGAQSPADGSARLRQLGFLDVSKAPYNADPTGQTDSTDAIQRAVDDARDNWLVCFFPPGEYLISDTISCEQKVQQTRASQDDGSQHTALLGYVSPHPDLWFRPARAADH